MPTAGLVALGRPIGNARTYVAGPDPDLLPIRVPGELPIRLASELPIAGDGARKGRTA